MFYCSVSGCNLSFRRKDNYSRHWRNVHGKTKTISPHVCLNCKADFKTISLYIDHIRKKHKSRTSFKQKRSFKNFIHEKSATLNAATAREAEKLLKGDIVKELSYYRLVFLLYLLIF